MVEHVPKNDTLKAYNEHGNKALYILDLGTG